MSSEAFTVSHGDPETPIVEFFEVPAARQKEGALLETAWRSVKGALGFPPRLFGFVVGLLILFLIGGLAGIGHWNQFQGTR